MRVSFAGLLDVPTINDAHTDHTALALDVLGLAERMRVRQAARTLLPHSR